MFNKFISDFFFKIKETIRKFQLSRLRTILVQTQKEKTDLDSKNRHDMIECEFILPSGCKGVAYKFKPEINKKIGALYRKEEAIKQEIHSLLNATDYTPNPEGFQNLLSKI